MAYVEVRVWGLIKNDQISDEPKLFGEVMERQSPSRKAF